MENKMNINEKVEKYLVESNSMIYSKLTKSVEWVLVDKNGKELSTFSEHLKAYREWEKNKNETYIINTRLSTKDFLAIQLFNKSQHQPEPKFKYEKIFDNGFKGKWTLVKNASKDYPSDPNAKGNY